MRVSIFIRTAQSQVERDLDISNRKEILHRSVRKFPPLLTVCGELYLALCRRGGVPCDINRITPMFS